MSSESTSEQLAFVIPGLDELLTKHATGLEQAVARTLDELKRQDALVELQAGKAQVAITAARLAEAMIAKRKMSNADRPLRLLYEVLTDITEAAASDDDGAFMEAMQALVDEVNGRP